MFFLQGAAPCYPLFLLTSSDNRYCQMILDVLLYRQSDVRALPNFQLSQNVSVRVIDVVDGILHDHRVLLSFERPSHAVLLLNVL